MGTIRNELKKRYIKRELARRNYKHYLEEVSPLFRNGKQIDLLTDRLQRLSNESKQRIIINMPPRHSKSFTITETYPSWLMQKNANTNVIISAYSGTIAKKFGGANKSKIENNIFDVSLTKDEKAKDTWKLDNNSRMIARGIGGSITGEGADLLIIDDPIKNQLEASSKVYRDRVSEEWESTLRTRLSPNANVILIMTRWHKDDLAGRLIKKGGWEVYNIPAVCNSENDILQREIGETIWKDYGFDEEWAEQTKKEIGSKAWNALYMGNPTDSENGMFKDTNFKYYREKEGHFILYNESEEKKVKKSRCLKFGTLDTAQKIEQANDYTVLSIFYITKDNDVLISEVYQKKIEVPKQYGWMKSIYVKEKLDFIGIEDKQSGIGIIQNARSDRITVKKLKADRSKELRAIPISIEYENGKVYHNLDMKNLSNLEMELAEFPDAEHDDIVDTVAYAGIIKSKYRNKKSNIISKPVGF